jgi:beta-glucanase (GH16 family)
MRPAEVLRSAALIAAALLAPALAVCADPAVPAPAGQQWNPTWSDEFNNPSSSAANNTGDFAGFSYDTGGGGWGNQELETYTTNAANVSVGAEGALHLTAIGTTSGGNTTYTSARIKTPNLFSQTYGLFEFRAKLPAGAGLWPALWMMPRNSTYGSWPTSGEIDVLESNANG